MIQPWEWSLWGGWKRSLRQGCPGASLGGSSRGGVDFREVAQKWLWSSLACIKVLRNWASSKGQVSPWLFLAGTITVPSCAMARAAKPWDFIHRDTEFSFALTDGKSQISSSPKKPALNVSLLWLMLQSRPLAISDLFNTTTNAKQISFRMGQKSTAQNTLYQWKAQSEAQQCLGRAQPEPREGKTQLVQSARSSEVDNKVTDLGGFSTYHLPLCCAQGEDVLGTLEKSIRIAPSTFQVLVPLCCLPTSSQEQFSLFLEVILKQSGVAFFNLCWYHAADQLSSTREAGKLCT